MSVVQKKQTISSKWIVFAHKHPSITGMGSQPPSRNLNLRTMCTTSVVPRRCPHYTFSGCQTPNILEHTGFVSESPARC